MTVVLRYFDGTYLFRGMSRTTWNLVPSIGRGRYCVDYNVGDEKETFELFKARARRCISIAPQNDWEWLALAQHHQLPTRLLDWSESPLVAAFFATLGWNGAPPKRRRAYDWSTEDSAVYVTHMDGPFEVANVKRSPFNVRKVEFFQPAHVSPRLHAQLGVFSLHPRPALPYAGPNVFRIIIPGCERLSFQAGLDTLGFSRATMFPDIDGLAQQLGWRFWAMEAREDA
jgi:hypothetical protein